MPKNNKLTLSNQAHSDLRHYIRMCNAEIGGFGYVTMDDNGDFFVDEIFLVEQTVTGTTVDFTDEGLVYAIKKAREDGRTNDMRFCWHSHVDMSAFWSGTDETMIENLNNGITPWFVSLVQNKKHEHEQRVDFFPPKGDISTFAPQITFELDLFYIPEKPDERLTEAYKELVTHEPIRPRTYSKGKSTSYSTSGTGYSPGRISEAREEAIREKVRSDGFNSLTALEKDDWEDIMARELSEMWGDYAYGDGVDPAFMDPQLAAYWESRGW